MGDQHRTMTLATIRHYTGLGIGPSVYCPSPLMFPSSVTADFWTSTVSLR